MATILVTGASRVRRQPRRPGADRRRPPGRRPGPRRRRGARSSRRRLPAGQRDALETRIGDVTEPATLPAALAGVDAVVHLAAIPRDFDGGAEPPPRQHRGHPERRPRGARGGRPAVRPPGRDGRRRRSRRSTTRARRRRRWRIVRESGLDWTDPRAVAAVRAARRVLQPHRRARPDVAGRRPDHRHRRGAVPAARDRRPRAGGRSTCSPTTTTIGREYPLGGPRYWTYREIVEEVLRGDGKAAGPRPDAGPADPPRRRRRPSSSGSRSRSPPTSCASCKLDNIGPLDARPRPRSGSSRGRWRAASPTSRLLACRTRSPAGRSGADRGAAAADRLRSAPCMRSAVRTVLLALVWLAVAVLIALGAAGIVASMNHLPGDAGAPRAHVDRRPGGRAGDRRRDRPAPGARRRGRRARRRRPARR